MAPNFISNGKYYLFNEIRIRRPEKFEKQTEILAGSWCKAPEKAKKWLKLVEKIKVEIMNPIVNFRA